LLEGRAEPIGAPRRKSEIEAVAEAGDRSAGPDVPIEVRPPHGADENSARPAASPQLAAGRRPKPNARAQPMTILV